MGKDVMGALNRVSHPLLVGSQPLMLRSGELCRTPFPPGDIPWVYRIEEAGTGFFLVGSGNNNNKGPVLAFLPSIEYKLRSDRISS